MYLYEEDGPKLAVIDAEPTKVRVSTKPRIAGYLDLEGVDFLVPLLQDQDRSVNIPEAREGVLYVVSGLAASVAQRPDVVSPAALIRETKGGRVRGCKALLGT